MGVHRIVSSDVRAQFPAGTVLHNPVSGEYARVVEHTPERVVGELLAVPGAAVAGPHIHPGQEERFEVLDGVMGYRRDTDRGELRSGESVTVPPGVVHDWWNAGDSNLRARVTVRPPGRFAAMIGAEAFGDEIVFERPPRAVQQALALTLAPIARRRGRSVTREVMRAALIPSERWPVQHDGSDASRPASRTSGTASLWRPGLDARVALSASFGS